MQSGYKTSGIPLIVGYFYKMTVHINELIGKWRWAPDKEKGIIIQLREKLLEWPARRNRSRLVVSVLTTDSYNPTIPILVPYNKGRRIHILVLQQWIPNWLTLEFQYRYILEKYFIAAAVGVRNCVFDSKFTSQSCPFQLYRILSGKIEVSGGIHVKKPPSHKLKKASP